MGESVTFIYQHLGMGDHIICNGLIRELINQTTPYIMFVQPQHRESVVQMYRDLNNMNYVSDDHRLFPFYLSRAGIRMDGNDPRLLMIGWKDWIVDNSMSFEWNFYRSKGVPFEKKWSAFKTNRNTKAESEIWNKANVKSDYVFVHDDERFPIDSNKLPQNVRIIKPNLGDPSIFNYSHIIENAQSVHCIESSFAFMIDAMNLNKNFVIHRYARKHKQPSFDLPMYKSVSQILT
jgi:hypothetical protein